MVEFIKLEDVSLRFDSQGDSLGTLAVKDLNLTVQQGEFVAVVGPSGCGKSTLMRLVTGLQFPTKGQVSVAGKPVTGPVPIAGMAFQNPIMLPWRKTRDNIMLPLEIVAEHRRTFRKNKTAHIKRADINIISQYNAQCFLLRETLKREGYTDPIVNTVVASQGEKYTGLSF